MAHPLTHLTHGISTRRPFHPAKTGVIKHAEVMKKNPDMEHNDPNAKRVLPYGNGELVWKFTKRGEFEFACLIPGHYEKGMFGRVIVK